MKFSTCVLLALLGGCSGHASHLHVRTSEDHYGQYLRYNSTRAQDHLPVADYAEETQVVRGMPLSIELIIGACWILMVCLMPLAAARYDRKLTKTQIIVGCGMLFAFLGGIWLFTNVIYFKSVHFDDIRSLTIVECVYLMAQILTTVGYGDIVPAKPRAQVFVALYVVFSILLIANCVSEVTSYLAEAMLWAQSQMERTTSSGLKKVLSTKGGNVSIESEDSIEQETQQLAELLAHKSPPLPWRQLIHKFLGWAFFVAAGIIFYSNYPGEDKNVWQSFYFSIITLSTVGFGAFTALTPGGMVFGAFWMLFGSFSLIGLVGAFTQMIYALKSREKWNIQKSQVHEDVLYRNLPERIDAAAFMKFAVEYTSLVTSEELKVIQGTFTELADEGKESVTREQALTLFNQEDQ